MFQGLSDEEDVYSKPVKTVDGNFSVEWNPKVYGTTDKVTEVADCDWHVISLVTLNCVWISDFWILI